MVLSLLSFCDTVFSLFQDPSPLDEPVPDDRLVSPVGWMIEAVSLELRGQVFLLDQAVFVVVGVPVSPAVAYGLHQFGWGVTQVERYRKRS